MTIKLQDCEDTSKHALDSEAIVAVVGSGTMGVGIAQLAAVAGHRVVLYDIRPEALTKAISNLKMGIQRLVDKARISANEGDRAVDRITPARSLSDLNGAGMVIEAVAEDLQVKGVLFR